MPAGLSLLRLEREVGQRGDAFEDQDRKKREYKGKNKKKERERKTV